MSCGNSAAWGAIGEFSDKVGLIIVATYAALLLEFQESLANYLFLIKIYLHHIIATPSSVEYVDYPTFSLVYGARKIRQPFKIDSCLLCISAHKQ